MRSVGNCILGSGSGDEIRASNMGIVETLYKFVFVNSGGIQPHVTLLKAMNILRIAF